MLDFRAAAAEAVRNGEQGMDVGWVSKANEVKAGLGMQRLFIVGGRLLNGSTSGPSSGWWELATSSSANIWNLEHTWCLTRPNKGRQFFIISFFANGREGVDRLVKVSSAELVDVVLGVELLDQDRVLTVFIILAALLAFSSSSPSIPGLPAQQRS
jgi:hypothetical protein